MLWPAIGLVVCACVFLYLETRKRGLTCCGHKKESQTTTGSRNADHSNGVSQTQHGGLEKATLATYNGPNKVGGNSGNYNSLTVGQSDAARRPIGYQSSGSRSNLAPCASSTLSSSSLGSSTGSGRPVKAPQPRLHVDKMTNLSVNNNQCVTRSMTSLDRINHHRSPQVEKGLDIRMHGLGPQRKLSFKSESEDRLRDLRINTDIRIIVPEEKNAYLHKKI